jgi:TetR/AcrR family transcriptional repressor of nem operon
MTKRHSITELPETKRKLVDAGVTLMRARGFNATSVDEICSAAGVTKGGFFHYFKSKEELARTALERFREGKAQDFAAAPFRKLADPLDRIFGRLDFVKASTGGKSGLTKGCLIGVFAQELSFTNPELRRASREAFLRTADDLEKDLAEAKALHAPGADFDPKKLSLFYVSIIQGGLMMAKAAESNDVMMDNLEQFRAHLQNLFGLSGRKKTAGISAKSRN